MIKEINYVTDPIVTHIWNCLHLYDIDDALFAAERLHCEIDSEETLFLVATCYFRQNRLKQCIKFIECSIFTIPKIKFLLAKSYLKLGNAESAINVITKNFYPCDKKSLAAIEFEYNEIACFVFLLLGDIYVAQDNDADASIMYQKCLELNPLLFTAYQKYLCVLERHEIENTDPADLFKVSEDLTLTLPILKTLTGDVCLKKCANKLLVDDDDDETGAKVEQLDSKCQTVVSPPLLSKENIIDNINPSLLQRGVLASHDVQMNTSPIQNVLDEAPNAGTNNSNGRLKQCRENRNPNTVESMEITTDAMATVSLNEDEEESHQSMILPNDLTTNFHETLNNVVSISNNQDVVTSFNTPKNIVHFEGLITAPKASKLGHPSMQFDNRHLVQSCIKRLNVGKEAISNLAAAASAYYVSPMLELSRQNSTSHPVRNEQPDGRADESFEDVRPIPEHAFKNHGIDICSPLFASVPIFTSTTQRNVTVAKSQLLAHSKNQTTSAGSVGPSSKGITSSHKSVSFKHHPGDSTSGSRAGKKSTKTSRPGNTLNSYSESTQGTIDGKVVPNTTSAMFPQNKKFLERVVGRQHQDRTGNASKRPLTRSQTAIDKAYNGFSNLRTPTLSSQQKHHLINKEYEVEEEGPMREEEAGLGFPFQKDGEETPMMKDDDDHIVKSVMKVAMECVETEKSSSLPLVEQHLRKNDIKVYAESWTNRFKTIKYYLTMFRSFARVYRSLALCNFPEAIECVKKGVSKCQKYSAIIQKWLAQAHNGNYSIDRAIFHLKRLHLNEPWQTIGMMEYSGMLWNNDREVDLCCLASEMLLLDQREIPDIWVIAGNCMSLHRDHDVALAYFKRAIQIDPHCAMAYRCLAHQYSSQNEHTLAVQMYSRSRKWEGVHYRDYVGISSVHMKQEKYLSAQISLKQALERFPTSVTIMTLLSHVCCHLKNFDGHMGALYYAERACALAPKQHEKHARIQRARVNYLLGRLKLVITELKELSTIYQHDATIFYFLGSVYKKLQMVPEAMEYLETAMEINPKGPPCQFDGPSNEDDPSRSSIIGSSFAVACASGGPEADMSLDGGGSGVPEASSPLDERQHFYNHLRDEDFDLDGSGL